MTILQNLIISQDSVNDEKVLITSIFFNDGDEVKKGDIVIEYETSKAIITIEAEYDGFISYKCKKGDYVLIGANIGVINTNKIDISIDSKKDLIQLHSTTESTNIKTLFSKKAKFSILQNDIDESIFYQKYFVTEEDVILQKNKSLKSSSSSNELEKSKNIFSNSNDFKQRVVIICPSMVGMEVIWDILDGQTNVEIVGFVADDSHKDKINLPFLNCNIDDFNEKINTKDYDAVVIASAGSLKSMQFRKKVFEKYIANGVPFTNLISKKAIICNNVTIGVGNIIGSNVFIGAGSQIGDNNFISYTSTIGHHNKIGDNNLFAPGVMMSGLVEVGSDCIFTTGVNFIDKVKIGNRVILPLGYNVIKNISDDTIIKIKD